MSFKLEISESGAKFHKRPALRLIVSDKSTKKSHNQIMKEANEKRMKSFQELGGVS